MRQSTKLLLNASVNVATGLTNMAVRLAVVPLAIHYIGKEAYGVYALVAGLALYTPYLRMGMASAVSRFSAAHLAKEEYDELNAVVNTAVVYYRVMSVLVVIAALVVAFHLVEYIVKNPDLHRVAFYCVLIFGGIEAVTMYVGPVGGVLRGLERFDLLQLPVTTFRVIRLIALVILLPRFGGKAGLVCVTAVMALTLLMPVVVNRFLALRYTPNLKLDMRLARRRLVWPLIAFGAGTITWSWAQMMVNYVPLVVIGVYMTTEHVAEYDVPAGVLLLVNMLVIDVMMVMSPTASKLTVTDRRDELRELFLRSSKYAAGVSVAGCAGIGILAPLLLYLWVGERFLHVAIVLTLLSAGRAMFYVQTSSFYILVGMARQRVPAIIAVTGVAAMTLAQVLVLGYTDWGLVGVAAVAAVVMALGWGLAIPIYGCRQVGLGLKDYYVATFVLPVLACIPASGAWLAMRFVPLSYGWFTLLGAMLGGTVLVGLGWWFVLFDDWDRRMFGDKLRALREKIRPAPSGAPSAGRGDAEDPTPDDKNG